MYKNDEGMIQLPSHCDLYQVAQGFGVEQALKLLLCMKSCWH